MKRTVATQLVMVNWRGVFYQRYKLDPRVTALEGANAAGKTTVMIAVYVVLLPDQRYLHFEPLAEGGTRSEDRGIWGRLGAGDAYSAVDFTLGNGERLVAGVRFERRGKDNGELHPFLVRGLPPKTSLQKLLLDRIDGHDEVPAPDRLPHLAALAGGRLTWSDSISSYLRDLFDAGVTPMPMSIDSEREKLDELLRTSMMGGISKKLGDGLRGFLLRPEESLGANLKTIRGNLDDCRRTRMQVNESRKAEEEIHEVLDAGARMFAAAVEGARRFAEERKRQVDDAERKRDDARAKYKSLEDRHADATAALAKAEAEAELAKDATEHAQQRERQIRSANGLWKKRREEEARLRLLVERVEEAKLAHDDAAEALRALEGVVREREADHTASAKGLADIQKGLERLHGRASRYRAVQAALGRARVLLPELELSDDQAPSVLERCRAEAAAASKELVAAQGRLESAQAQEQAFRRVLRALQRIADRAVGDGAAHGEALAVLADLRRLERLVDELAGLRARKREAVEHSSRQIAARRRAAELATADEPVGSSSDLDLARTRGSSKIEECREALSDAGVARDRLKGEVKELESRVARLALRADDYRRLRAVVDAVGGRWERAAETSEEVVAMLRWLQGELLGERRRIQDVETQVAGLEQRLQGVRNVGGAFPEGLVEACAAVDGRLLIERFDDVPYERAAEVEARLGPWVHAILVDDPERAVETLEGLEDRPESLWILDGPRLTVDPEHLPPGRLHGNSVATSLEEGVRFSRLPDAPVIGRQARVRLIRKLEAELKAAEELLADARDRQRRLDADVELVTPLLPKAALLDAGDPAKDLGEAHERLKLTQQWLAEAERAVEATQEALGRLLARGRVLDALWKDAALLDPPDYAEQVAVLDEQIVQASRAQRRLDETTADRAVLQNELDVLRSPPLDEAARAALQHVVSSAQARRGYWLAPQADLDSVKADLEALGFGDAEAKIHDDEAMLASLNEEVKTAELKLVDARKERDSAKEKEAAAEGVLREAKGQRDACQRRIGDLQQELEQAGVDDASDEALDASVLVSAKARAEHEAALTGLRSAVELVAGLEPQVRTAREQVETADGEVKEKEAQAGPAVLRWGALRDRCAELGLLDAALADPGLEEVSGKASIDVFQLRQRWWALMLERLEKASDGKVLADALRLLDRGSTEAGSEQYLRAWLQTREWLARRVPKHVSEVDDPVEALRKLRRHLDGLVDKLQRFEHRLRGNSKDIARAIEARLRKVNNLLTKLNRDLRGVGFGSIEAIRVKSEREPKMNEILGALTSEEGQQELFGEKQTIEEALDELFQRHGGRRAGGQRILDYREYLRLRVEVRRRGSEVWEEIRGNQMSTGEAIGVGAAIMMVVLTAWEREAGLLRARREDAGTLRFLFLDEATRLSLDSLEVLFELCGKLELQLLVAAPEIATSSGNITYVMERTTDEEKREVVRVSGRRAIRGEA